MGVTDLPDDLQQKLGKWEANKPENRSVRALEDIASMVQEALSVLGEKPDDTHEKEMGAILVDMRESLAAIKNKDYPKMPDYSKPLLAGLEKLEKAFTKIDVRPEFRPNIQVDSPAVTVEASKVDLKGVEKVLKKDIPEAFREAVKLIPVSPAVELTPLENLLREMSEQLSSIDTASRLKPQFPTTLKVTNPDGSPIGGGGDGPIEIADGDDVTQGAIADAAASAGGAGTMSAKLRRLTTDTNSILTGQTDGTQKTQIVDGSNNIIGSNGSGLNVNLQGNDVGIALESGGNLATLAGTVSGGRVLVSAEGDINISQSLPGTTNKVSLSAYNGSSWDDLRNINGLGGDNDGLGVAGEPIVAGTRSWLWNGSAWDRERSNTRGMLIGSGTSTTETDVLLTTYNASFMTLVVNVSVAGGGDVTVVINGVTSSGYTYNMLTSAALSSVATTPLRIFPGAVPSPNVTANDMVPRIVSVTATVTGSIEYGIDWILGA